jgi:hypothetical protein
MGKQVDGKLRSAILELGHGGWLHQGSGIGEDREVLVIEQRLQAGKAGMEGEWGADAWGRDGQQGPLRQGQAAARRLVGVVTCGVEGNDHVIAVIAAEQEHAHQRLVVGGGLRQRIDKPEAAEAGGRKTRGSGTTGRFQKISTAPFAHGVVLLLPAAQRWTWNCEELPIR